MVVTFDALSSKIVKNGVMSGGSRRLHSLCRICTRCWYDEIGSEGLYRSLQMADIVPLRDCMRYDNLQLSRTAIRQILLSCVAPGPSVVQHSIRVDQPVAAS